MKDFIQELARMKMTADFFKTWADEKLWYLEGIAEVYFKNNESKQDDDKPEWKQIYVPRLVKNNDQTTPEHQTVYRSWDDYFRKQRKIVNTFLRSGEITPFCEELRWFVREIVADKRTFYVLKKWLLLLLDVLSTARLAKNPVALLYEIERQTLSFDRSLYYFGNVQKVGQTFSIGVFWNGR